VVLEDCKWRGRVSPLKRVFSPQLSPFDAILTTPVHDYGCDVEMTFMNEGLPMELDLCDLLSAMKLGCEPQTLKEERVLLSESIENGSVAEDLSPQLDVNPTQSRSNHDEHHGCAYLQAIQAQLEIYPTTGGDYLEAIFTHREILSAFPEGHRYCARGFNDIAYALEHRAWRADRDADCEAVSAFRYEAWLIADR